MNSDYRVSVTWRDSLKRKKLLRKLGPEAVLAVMDLWSVTAEQRPDGVLQGWNADDIELQISWDGKPGELVSVLVDLGLLDMEKQSNTYIIHDWMQWNSWAAGAARRSESARAASEARWNKKCSEYTEGNAPSMPEACSEHADGNADGNADGVQGGMHDDALGNAPYLTLPNPSSPNSPTPPPPTPGSGAELNPHLQDQGQDQGQGQGQSQVVGGGDRVHGQDQNPKPGFEEGGIEELLRVLWEYRASEGINDPESFFPWKREKLKKEGMTEKDLQDLARLRKKEAQEVTKEEQKRNASVEEEERNRRKNADENMLYAKYEQLPELERKRVERQAQEAGTSPGGPLWRSQIALIMSDYNACSGEVGALVASCLSGLR